MSLSCLNLLYYCHSPRASERQHSGRLSGALPALSHSHELGELAGHRDGLHRNKKAGRTAWWHDDQNKDAPILSTHSPIALVNQVISHLLQILTLFISASAQSLLSTHSTALPAPEFYSAPLLPSLQQGLPRNLNTTNLKLARKPWALQTCQTKPRYQGTPETNVQLCRFFWHRVLTVFLFCCFCCF